MHRRQLRQLRLRCEAILRDLDVPSPFDLETFCAMLANRRGRPILLHPVVTQELWSVWIPRPTSDWILYEAATSRLHQQHLVLVQLAHILLEHAPDDVTDPQQLKLLFPDLDPGLLPQRLARPEPLRGATTAGKQRREVTAEAELLASLIRLRSNQRRPPHATHSTEPLTRLAATLKIPTHA